MKINTNRVTAAYLNKTKSQTTKETSVKESFSTDKIEISSKAKEQLLIHDEKSKIAANIEEKYSEKSLSHVKKKIADKQYHVNHDELAASMMDFMKAIKGE
jgi:anti-sigma28 factor (negative regulator of flagellin synthesis)